MVTARFDAIDMSMRDWREQVRAMHTENSDELHEIKAEVRSTNGRLIAAEEHIKTLFHTVKSHTNAIASGAGAIAKDIKWWLTVLGCGFGAGIWLLTYMGYHR